MVVFDKAYTPGKLKKAQRAALPGIDGIVLHFPVDISPLGKLGVGVKEGGEGVDLAVPYTLYVRGLLTSLSALRKLLNEWSKKGGAVCEGLDIAVHGMEPEVLVNEVLSLFQTTAMLPLKNLSLRFAGLTNEELMRLHAGLMLYAADLETLILSSNNLREDVLGEGGGVLALVGASAALPSLRRIDIQGNALAGQPDLKVLAEALAKRGADFTLRVGHNSLAADALQAAHDALGTRVDWGGGGLPSESSALLRQLFHRHPLRAEEVPAAGALVLWPEQLVTLLRFGTQPLRAVDLSGARLNLQEIAFLLQGLNPAALQKLSLARSFGEGSEVPGNHDPVLERLEAFTDMTSLDLSGNFSEMATLQRYLTVVATFNGLVHLGLAGNTGAFAEGFDEVMEALKAFSALRVLDFQTNGLEDRHLTPLAAVFRDMRQLNVVNLAHNVVTLGSAESWRALMAMLGPVGVAAGKDGAPSLRESNLQCLDLRGNNISGDRVGVASGDYPPNFPPLMLDGIVGGDVRGELLVLGNGVLLERVSKNLYQGPFPLSLLQMLPTFSGRAAISGADLPFLVPVLTQLRVLDLGHNLTVSLDDVSKILQHNTALTDVRIDGMEMGGYGLRVLQASLIGLSHLTRLDVSGNNLGKEGLELLQSALTDKPLRFLGLANNALGKGGAKALGTLLPVLPRLRELDLNGNRLSKGTNHLGMALSRLIPTESGAGSSDGGPERPGLEVLTLSGNGFTAKDMKTLSLALVQPSLNTLKLGFNRLGDKGVTALISGLPPSLRVLDLSGNGIKERGASDLEQFLQIRAGLQLIVPSQAWTPEIGRRHFQVFVNKGRVVMDAGEKRGCGWC